MSPMYKSVNGVNVEMTPEEIAEFTAEWTYNASTDYELKRLAEYPPISDLADAIYWQAKGDETKMDAYLAAVEAVKLKYPKPENT